MSAWITGSWQRLIYGAHPGSCWSNEYMTAGGPSLYYCFMQRNHLSIGPQRNPPPPRKNVTYSPTYICFFVLHYAFFGWCGLYAGATYSQENTVILFSFPVIAKDTGTECKIQQLKSECQILKKWLKCQLFKSERKWMENKNNQN